MSGISTPARHLHSDRLLALDYLTVHDPTAANLTAEEQGELYSQLASGAESGWDFTSRFAADPTASGNALLRSYNVKNQIAIDLNSILCKWLTRYSHAHVVH